MTAYVRMVGDFVRARFGGSDAGQNMVETAMIVGIMSLVIVFAFMTADIDTGLGNLAERIGCEVQGDTWDSIAATCADGG